MNACASHPQVAATYRCEGCERLLCADCIEESYRLLLCRDCGERAMPLDGEQPATLEEVEKARAVARTYTFRDTLTYPFRGTGLYIFFFALFVVFGSQFGGIRVRLLMWALIAGLQFHIVRKTVRGDDELEDWPDITAWSDLLPDFFAWVILEGFLTVLIGAYLGVGFFGGLLGLEPSFIGALLLALLLWLGAAFQVIGYGAVGSYSIGHLFMVHLHVIGYRRTLGDALKFTNLLFGLRGAVFLATAVVGFIPILGGIFSVFIGTYWVFLVPHLSGLLFRRNEAFFDELYLGS